MRPGSMTAVMRAVEIPRAASGPRWLRFAVVRDGRIVQEATLSPDKTLSVGHGGDVVTAAPTREIASCHAGVWRLRVAPGWRGRTAEGELGELAGEALADGWRTLELDSRARAKIELEGCALLLQIVAPPPVRTAPRLPVGLQQGIFERADWAFTAFVAASFMMHFAAIAWLMEADWPVETGIPERVAVVIFPDQVIPPDPVEVDDATSPDDETAETVDEEVVADNSTPNPTDSTTADARPRPRNDSPPQPSITPDEGHEIATATAEVLGALLGQRDGAFRNVIEHGAPTDDQASILSQFDGTRPPDHDPGDMPGVRPGPGGCRGCDRDLSTLRARVTRGPVREGPPVEERIITVTGPRQPVDEPQGEDVLWDPRELHRTLGARMSAVRRCYENAITHGTVQGGGRITVTMQVMPVGTLSSVRAVENTTGSDALAACATRVVRGVRVRTGPSSPMTVRYPIVFSRQE